MLTKLKIALALCGSLAGGVAVADGFHGGAPRTEILQKYDTNKDGKLDDTEKAAMKADFKAKHAQREAEMLAKFDTNKDGKLDDAEKAAMRDARATEEFQKLDTNKDGQISLDEFKAGRAKMEMHRHARGRFHRGSRKGVSKG
ncbi:MAG: EF-hand domain-containing protein [Deltaproteobacteria bacterium]|nr:EF-hand domain-containing protein [Deltaproteobacteria bacterium]